MDDYISRQAAIEVIKDFKQGAAEWKAEQEERSDIWHRADSAIASALEIGLRIKKLPSAQEPVRRGRWVRKEKIYPELPNDSDYRYECSLCGWSDQHNAKMIVPYCWHCGAKMEMCR